MLLVGLFYQVWKVFLILLVLQSGGLLKKKLGHQHGTGLHMPWESVWVMEEKSGQWNYVYPFPYPDLF